MTIIKRPHAIVLAIPTQGHIKPMMHFSKILSARGFYITFVNTEFIQAKMIKSGSGNSMADFRFETLPDGLPPNHGRTTHADELCKSISDNWPPLFEELIEKLEKLSDVPPLTCIVYNSHLSWAQKTAERLGIPGICFWTASACGFNIYYSAPLLMEKGYIPLKDKSYLTNGYLEEELSCIPGMPLLRMKDVPSLYYDASNYMFHFLQTHTQSAMSADFLIINTFDELEGPVMETLRAILPAYSIGPLLLSAASAEKTPALSNMISASIFSEEKNCVEWLDDQKHGSVLYVCFGSMVVISDRELVELAWGLEASEEPFLWAIRPDLVNGSSAVLPTEFVDKVKGRGCFVSWAPQVEVLSHPSVGGFLTHNGWNSTLESICSGVPMISWSTSHGEQQINRTYVSQIWKIGISMSDVVERGQVEDVVKRLMRGKEGEEMRKRIGELKDASITAVNKGGSSYNDLEKILVEIEGNNKIGHLSTG